MFGFLTRFSAYGDLAGKALRVAVRSVPWFLEPIFLFCYAIIYTIVSRPPLRAAQQNLDVIFAHKSAKPPIFAQFQLIYQFSATMAEGLRAIDDPECIKWTVEGMDQFQQLINEDQGAILLTVHMGSYDLAAASFVEKLGRNVNIVRTPERDLQTQKLREAEIEETRIATQAKFGDNAPTLKVHFNRSESLLGVDLASALHRKEFVAIQGDRVMFDVSAITAPCCSSNIRMPKGPFVLAEATRAPIYPLIILRKGWRHYAVRCLKPLPTPTVKERTARIDERATYWGKELETLITNEWHQWFVFEQAFNKEPEPKHPDKKSAQ